AWGSARARPQHGQPCARPQRGQPSASPDLCAKPQHAVRVGTRASGFGDPAHPSGKTIGGSQPDHAGPNSSADATGRHGRPASIPPGRHAAPTGAVRRAR
ncbi:MAG: hypothetical protein WAT58_11395, partial [Candidatus Dormiibacterota bacterium]